MKQIFDLNYHKYHRSNTWIFFIVVNIIVISFTIIILTFLMIIITIQDVSKNEKILIETERQLLSVQDSIPLFLPDTAYTSVNSLIFQVDIFDDSVSGVLANINDIYSEINGILNFRGSPSNSLPFYGEIAERPTNVTVEWVFKTDYGPQKTLFGIWGGGTGWTGQPLYVTWPDSIKNDFIAKSPGLTDSFTGEEIIVASLCGNVYFIDYQTGKQSRQAIDVQNPVKGTPSLDPSFNGNLYIGHGIPRNKSFGKVVVNLFLHHQTQFFDEDNTAWRRWGAYDSSPVAVDKFLFWCGENGTVYKYLRDNQLITLHSTLRYHVKGRNAPGMESTPAIYRDYGYLTDNHGNIICFNLNTLKPVWVYDNHDDTDASPVVVEENGLPVVYTGCEVDRQGREGFSYFVKLNGLTGEKIWEQKISGKRLKRITDWSDGGMFATPLIGIGDCDSLVFCNFCIHQPALKGEFIAFNRYSGDLAYHIPLKHYAWSSPVGFSNKKGEMFVFTADAIGNIYLIQGATGEILLTQKIGHNFESSPVMIGNSIVIGSRGREIYKLCIE